MEWQPIETAPRDGTLIFVTANGSLPLPVRWEQKVSAWRFGIGLQNDPREVRFSVEFGFESWPTHWIPIPELPK